MKNKEIKNKEKAKVFLTERDLVVKKDCIKYSIKPCNGEYGRDTYIVAVVPDKKISFNFGRIDKVISENIDFCIEYFESIVSSLKEIKEDLEREVE